MKPALTLEDFAALAGVPLDQLRDWSLNDPDFPMPLTTTAAGAFIYDRSVAEAYLDQKRQGKE